MRKFTVAALVAVLALGVGTSAALAHSSRSHSRSHKSFKRHHRNGKAHRLSFQQAGTQNTSTTTSPTTTGSKLEGTVTAVDTTARTLTVMPEESNTPVTVDVPAQFDISQFSQNQDVELIVSDNGDGTFTLVSTDDNEQGDNNQGDQSGQGDQGDDDGQQQSGGSCDGQSGSGTTSGSDSGSGGGGDD